MSEQTITIEGGQLHTSFDDAGAEISKFATKTEDGKAFPASDFAFVPDRDRPSTWKLRLTSTPGGTPDTRIVGAAVAALGKGFRGNRVQLPADVVSAVKARVRAAWKKAHPDATDDDVPEVIRAAEVTDPKQYQLKEINDIEIFRAGTWNGDQYTANDLDEMVRNFERVGFKPPVKLGHSEKSGGQAFGWVKALRRIGDKLVADFQDIPEQLFQKIKDRAFDTVSSEIFWNLSRNGQKFKRVLKAVALLGAETPAVSGLKPLRESFTADELRAVHYYTLQHEDFQMADTKQLDDALAKLKEYEESNAKLLAQMDEMKKQGDKKEDDDLVLQLKNMKERQEEMAKDLAEAKERERGAVIQTKLDKLRVPAFTDHVRALYEFVSSEPKKTVMFSTMDDKGQPVKRETPFVSVLDDLVERINKTSEFLFREHSTVGDWKRDDVQSGESPGEEVDRLTRAYMQKHGKEDYQVAMQAVLADPDNQELKRQYAAV